MEVPMPDEFTQKYQDVLQNIESIIVDYYHENPELADYNVDRVLENLMRLYTAETKGRTFKLPTFAELEQKLLDRVKAACDMWLGRTGDLPKEAQPKTAEEMAACLKRIRRSIQLWTKEYGRRGYLDYVNQFFPDD